MATRWDKVASGRFGSCRYWKPDTRRCSQKVIVTRLQKGRWRNQPSDKSQQRHKPASAAQIDVRRSFEVGLDETLGWPACLLQHHRTTFPPPERSGKEKGSTHWLLSRSCHRSHQIISYLCFIRFQDQRELIFHHQMFDSSQLRWTSPQKNSQTIHSRLARTPSPPQKRSKLLLERRSLQINQKIASWSHRKWRYSWVGFQNQRTERRPWIF